jgi:DNA phosphorothioation-dependent restriction protein DptH
MSNLVKELIKQIQEKVRDEGHETRAKIRESRYIFHGPPLSILDQVFEFFELNNGANVAANSKLDNSNIPVLLQLSKTEITSGNPAIGESGRCDEDHLLDVRNVPGNNSSFLALIPPGQHSNMSVASTTEEFGVSRAANTLHSTIDEWWGDEFVHTLVIRGLNNAGFRNNELEDAVAIVKSAIYSIDDLDQDNGDRSAAWHLISRIYSIPEFQSELSNTNALSLACGIPSKSDNKISAKSQLGTLAHIASEMNDGFRTGIEQALNSIAAQNPDIQKALNEFLEHIQKVCDIPTAFERSTEAFYLPAGNLAINFPAPFWWSTLTTETWSEILSNSSQEISSELHIECLNSLIPPTKGLPLIVRDEVKLKVLLSNYDEINSANEITISGGKFKPPKVLKRSAQNIINDIPPEHKTPITYKVASAESNSATLRLISLNTWTPGIFITCRLASKVSIPKKPRKSGGKSPWETNLSLPGSGRYELLIFIRSGITITNAVGVADDSSEVDDLSVDQLNIHEIKPYLFQVEVEAENKYQLEISFTTQEGTKETCMVFLTCEETKEEGCRSEFERLIKLNRKHLEKFDTKTVVQLDRHARISSMQSWLLDSQHVTQSFKPLVLSDDYVDKWAPPDWNLPHGPILSNAEFLHDPRPDFSNSTPPDGFIAAREQLAARIRATSDNVGLIELAPLGKWLTDDPSFRTLVENYLSRYAAWLTSDRDIACWVDVTIVCTRSSDGRTLERIPDAVILSPLHPLRFAWHCLAQQVLIKETEGTGALPCPASSILDPDCIPDCLELSLQSPRGTLGIEKHTFLSIECNSDYWSVLWNGARLKNLNEKSGTSPFDKAFGLSLGGISSGFSPAQVSRALEDVSEILSAKSIIGLTVSSAGGASDACNDGLMTWCTKRFGKNDIRISQGFTGPRLLEIYDIRPETSRPDQASIANLCEDTGNSVRWFNSQPNNAKPDIGIVAQLDSAEAEATSVGMKSPMGLGGLIRHRIRRQLNGTFLCESRQGLTPEQSGDFFADKIASCITALEDGEVDRLGLQFSPNVPSISAMLTEKNANFVAVSSSAIDPSCFLGGWIEGTYLWDYDLPSYSHRAGDSSGYYLLSQIRDADRDALKRVLQLLNHNKKILDEELIENVLIEIARRGIPTVRGMSSDDTGATGDLGLFLASRLLQDQFRLTENLDSLLPVLNGTDDKVAICIIVPVDPFRGYLADLSKSLSQDKSEISLLRPDLMVIGIRITNSEVMLKLTPLEVKCRLSNTFTQADSKEALLQAKALSNLLSSLQNVGKKSAMWNLAFQHLLLSMVGFGLRVYSQHSTATQNSNRWAKYHELIAHEILKPKPNITIDKSGRLIVIDNTAVSDARDNDEDGFLETIVISMPDAGKIVSGDPLGFYESVKRKVADWQIFPDVKAPNVIVASEINLDSLPVEINNIEEKFPKKIIVNKTDTHSKKAGSNGVVLSLGCSSDGFEPRSLQLNISDTRLNNLNLGVVGDLGTGKTQLLKSLIFQIASSTQLNREIKPRLLIFDYKRDYSTPDFVEATGAKVIKPSRLPLNLFDTSSMEDSVQPWLDRFRFFADVLDKVYSGIGPVQRDKLKNAVRKAYQNSQNGVPPTIYEIHAEYREILGDKTDSPMSIIDDLVDMEMFEKNPQNTVSFDKFLDGIVVISLDALGQDDRSKNMLVAIMLNMFYENMLKTPKRPFQGDDPQLRVVDSYLLVDEADNIMRYEFDVLRKLLLQGREFGTGVILASQYLRHFKTSGTDYRDPLLTWFIHKVPNVTAQELGALGFTSDLGELSERVKTLPNHHCLYKSFGVLGEVIKGLPFYELMAKSNS